jgi:hypothetical protein
LSASLSPVPYGACPEPVFRKKAASTHLSAFRRAGTLPDANMRRTRWTRDWPCGFETTLCNVRDRPRPRRSQTLGRANALEAPGVHTTGSGPGPLPRARRDGVPCKWQDSTRQSMLVYARCQRQRSGYRAVAGIFSCTSAPLPGPQKQKRGHATC